jgi:hypothetical protein
MRKATKPSESERPRTVSITKDGKEFEGEYYTKRGVVYVRYGSRRKATQVGGSPASSIARHLLRELVGK